VSSDLEIARLERLLIRSGRVRYFLLRTRNHEEETPEGAEEVTVRIDRRLRAPTEGSSVRTLWKIPVVTLQALARLVPHGPPPRFTAILDSETSIAFTLDGATYNVEDIGLDAVYYTGVLTDRGRTFCIECAEREGHPMRAQLRARRFRTTARVPDGKRATTCACGKRITVDAADVPYIQHGPMCHCAHLEVLHEPGGRCLGTGADMDPMYQIPADEACACEAFEHGGDE